MKFKVANIGRRHRIEFARKTHGAIVRKKQDMQNRKNKKSNRKSKHSRLLLLSWASSGCDGFPIIVLSPL